MNIILLGPPGAGKGTQADIICHKLDIPKISTGDMLRAAIAKGDAFGNQIKEYVNAGNLVPDAIIVKILKLRITQSDCETGFLLDGFPRTINQAESLQQSGVKIDLILQLHVPDGDIIKRLSGRRVHLASGRTYHILHNPPKNTDVDDITGELLTQRPDDSESTVTNRLQVYRLQTEPLIAWYKQRIDDLGTRYELIDALKSVAEVDIDINKIINVK